MSYVYVYDPDDDSDCSTIGLVGALMPISCEFEIEAGAFGELTLQHPKDEYGKWLKLTDGAILKTAVPCRLPPDMDEDSAYVATVEQWTISKTASKKERALYKKEDGKTKATTLSAGQIVTYVCASLTTDYVKVKAKVGKKTYTGWISESILDKKIKDVSVPATSSGAENANASYAVQYQLFRIYNTVVDDSSGGSVTVKARRIPYDLLGNITKYTDTNADITGITACRGVINNTVVSHSFKIYSDVSDARADAEYDNMNPIEALLSDDTGIVNRWNAQIINDDFDIYMLHSAGMDRGLRIEYAKNLTGVKCEVDTSDVAVGIRPKGSKKDGSALYLSGTSGITLPSGYSMNASNGTVIYKDSVKDSYPIPKIAALDVSDAKISNDVSESLAKARMVEAAVDQFESGCSEPTITLTVEFVMLGDTEEYSQFRNLESVFVYDTVHIRHKPLGISSDIACVSLTWDCLTDRPTKATFGALESVSASVASWQISSASVGSASSGSGSVSYAQLTAACKQSIMSAVVDACKDSGSDLYKAIQAIITQEAS